MPDNENLLVKRFDIVRGKIVKGKADQRRPANEQDFEITDKTITGLVIQRFSDKKNTKRPGQVKIRVNNKGTTASGYDFYNVIPIEKINE